ncbi:MAG: sugar ABC transporter substrate-binding protein [Oscillibacter sp.]|nr:sugar ABC transporter substrate-binding protein [Oscillibacter sp.]
MKRREDLIQVGILAILGAAVLLSLALPPLFQSREGPPLLSLSVLLREPGSWTAAREGMEQAAEELGAELRFLTSTTPNDSGEQADLLLREIDGGAAALVAVPADPEALSAALDQWLVVCPVVTLESPMRGAAGTAAPDNALLGQRLAQALLEDWTGGEEVLLLESAGGGVRTRLEAAQETLEAAGVPVRRAGEREAAARWMMAFDASTTLRLAGEREAEGLDFTLYGVGSATGLTAQLERGNLAALAAWSDYAAGYLAVQRAVEAARGTDGQVEPLGFSIIRKEDIYGSENQKLLFPVTS